MSFYVLNWLKMPNLKNSLTVAFEWMHHFSWKLYLKLQSWLSLQSGRSYKSWLKKRMLYIILVITYLVQVYLFCFICIYAIYMYFEFENSTVRSPPENIEEPEGLNEDQNLLNRSGWIPVYEITFTRWIKLKHQIDKSLF